MRPRHLPRLLPWKACAAIFALALALTAVSCRSGNGNASSGGGNGVTIESLLTRAAPTSSTSPLVGGKPADPGAGNTTPVASDTPATQADVSGGDPPATPTAGPPRTSDGSTPPTSGRWIDVDVTRYVVRLMDGAAALREIAPVAVGEQIDNGAYASTQTGLFQVNNKIADLAYDPPYNTYISNWVGFDPDRANGFHSFLEDKDGHVVNAASGRVSNGCIRTGAADAIFAFAEPGMPVYVHW